MRLDISDVLREVGKLLPYEIIEPPLVDEDVECHEHRIVQTEILVKGNIVFNCNYLSLFVPFAFVRFFERLGHIAGSIAANSRQRKHRVLCPPPPAGSSSGFFDAQSSLP